tara:strand:- start:729 stop:1142 length:414 start_codon:yes stop_codon:yes gene_type:complete
MFEEIKHIKTGKKELRSFGVTIGIILLLIAGFLFYKEKESFQLFIYIASSFIGIGFIIPILLKPIYIIWMTFAIILGWFMTRVILSLLFFVIITPIGIILRLFGKDFLDIKKQAIEESYWNIRTNGHLEKENFEKQF